MGQQTDCQVSPVGLNQFVDSIVCDSNAPRIDSFFSRMGTRALIPGWRAPRSHSEMLQPLPVVILVLGSVSDRMPNCRGNPQACLDPLL